MNSIQGLLERYKNFVPPARAASRAVASAVKEIVCIDVAEEHIAVRGGRADISISAIEKTEILLNKEAILANAQKRIGGAVREIR
jgi:hypothetical protein